MKLSVLALGCIGLLISCGQPESNKTEYPRWTGDIEFNPKTDDPDFNICYGEDSIYQYFNFSQGLQYAGEKLAIIKAFEQYEPVLSEESGLIRIRFVVNCNGKTDRFRIISSDWDYQEKEFDPEIVGQLMQITKSLDGWLPQPAGPQPRDYYQYLIFKIEKGALTEILP